LKEEIVQADRGGAESVRLDDVRARFEITPVDFVDNGGLGQEEHLEPALEVLPFPIFEPLAAVIRFGQLVSLDHRAHRAVEHDDAVAQQRFEGMEIFDGHGGGELNCSSRPRQGTN
jgi:hypothetical protein